MRPFSRSAKISGTNSPSISLPNRTTRKMDNNRLLYLPRRRVRCWIKSIPRSSKRSEPLPSQEWLIPRKYLSSLMKPDNQQELRTQILKIWNSTEFRDHFSLISPSWTGKTWDLSCKTSSIGNLTEVNGVSKILTHSVGPSDPSLELSPNKMKDLSWFILLELSSTLWISEEERITRQLLLPILCIVFRCTLNFWNQTGISWKLSWKSSSSSWRNHSQELWKWQSTVFWQSQKSVVMILLWDILWEIMPNS